MTAFGQLLWSQNKIQAKQYTLFTKLHIQIPSSKQHERGLDKSRARLHFIQIVFHERGSSTL